MFTPTNWQITKRLMVHVFLVALGAAFVAIEQWISGHSFGSYQVLAMAVNTVVVTAVEKFFFNQGITLPATAINQ